MKAQCPCIMGPERTPVPDCDKCDGTGFWEVSFPDDNDIEALWIGRCPACGCENGGHFQQKGKLSPLKDEYEQKWPPPCLDNNCPCKHVQWIKADDIITAWIAVCPICNTGHWCNYLQLANDPLSTPEAIVRQCPKEDCQHSPMIWLRADDLE